MSAQGERDESVANAAKPPVEHSEQPAPSLANVQNTVIAGEVSGVVVQAHTITGGIHYHLDSGRRPVPRQLPSAPPAFVGRTAELDALTSVLEQAASRGRTVVISALAGAGGIGKTWLAVHWAHVHQNRFPDGHLFVDLQGFSPTGMPMESAVALRGFLDALGVEPNQIPKDQHAQIALYRSLVAGKRMLVVLDNAATVEQLVPLLPGDPGCTVVVTSRRRLTGLVIAHGAHPVHLDVLSEAEARRLLTSRLGPDRITAEPDAVANLLAVCDGFPLALAIVAGHARIRTHTSLAVLASELADAATRLNALDSGDPGTSMAAVLSWSHRTLTTQQREVFALLAIAPGPSINLLAAASLTALSEQRTARLLGELEEASLLDHDGQDRYRMHDIIRSYAVATADKVDVGMREAALRRVLDFYSHTAYAADRLLDPHRVPPSLGRAAPGVQIQRMPDAAAAMAWLEVEHACLLAAQRTAASNHWYLTVWHIAWSLTTFHLWQGHRHDMLTAWHTAADAASHLHEPGLRSRAHRALGRTYADLGHHDQAIEHLNEALVLAERDLDVAQQAHIHRALGRAWGQRGNDQRALDHIRRALDLYRDVEHPVSEARALNAMAWHAARLGEYERASEYGRVAHELFRRHHSPDGESSALDNLGYIEHHIGNYVQAIDYYRKALALRRELGHNYYTAETLDRLGSPHEALGQTDQAREVWQEARTLYQDQGRDRDAKRVQLQLDGLDNYNVAHKETP